MNKLSEEIKQRNDEILVHPTENTPSQRNDLFQIQLVGFLYIIIVRFQQRELIGTKIETHIRRFDILAGIGAGVFKDFSVIDRFVRIEQTVQPIQENVKKYEAWMPVFDKAYHALCDMYTEIAKTELDSI